MPPLRRVCTVKPSAKNETNCRSCEMDKSESGRPSSNLGQIVRRKSASPNVSELRACKRSEKLTGALLSEGLKAAPVRDGYDLRQSSRRRGWGGGSWDARR